MNKEVTDGVVYLVGAGPGDPGLLTMKAAELISEADVLVYDALANPDFLKMAPEGCELIYAGKRSKNHAIPQGDVNQLLADKAKEGKNVVRLKGGDPYLFGRGGEEAEKLHAEGVRFEVVPGISSIYAAPGYAGVPVTHRDFCSGFTVITGHEDPTKAESSLDYAHLARTRETLVVLMGVERIGIIASELIANGMAPGTAVSMTRWGTTGRQKTITGTLATIADEVKKHDFKAPAVTVIGGVVALREKLNWFETRPLFGQRVVVTRTRQQASQLSRKLTRLGAEVLEIPTIRTEEPDKKSMLKDAFSQLGSYEWIVFTSPNGVEWFFSWFFKVFKDIRAIGGAKIAAVGPATAKKIEEYHLQIDAMPRKYVAGEIVEAIKEVQNIENVMILLMRAQVANPDLPDQLTEAGAIVDDIPCYKTVQETEDLNGAVADFQESGADWITFTSSSTVEHFHDRFDLPATLKKFPDLKTASIGPETSRALHELGLQPTIEAETHTIPGLVQAIESYRSADSECD